MLCQCLLGKLIIRCLNCIACQVEIERLKYWFTVFIRSVIWLESVKMSWWHLLVKHASPRDEESIYFFHFQLITNTRFDHMIMRTNRLAVNITLERTEMKWQPFLMHKHQSLPESICDKQRGYCCTYNQWVHENFNIKGPGPKPIWGKSSWKCQNTHE